MGKLESPEHIFWAHVTEVLRPDSRVLDFGAGRQNSVLGDLRPLCARVDGCDISPEVLDNSQLTAAALVADSRLPYSDAAFDLIVSSYVWEHLRDPDAAMAEMLRVLKPGGHILAITSNAWGYVALAARLVPNGWHRAVLRAVQPDRSDQSIFPTVYRINTRKAVARRLGPHGKLEVAYASGEPSYHFGSRVLYGLFRIVHRLLPEKLHTTICVSFRKAG